MLPEKPPLFPLQNGEGKGKVLQACKPDSVCHQSCYTRTAALSFICKVHCCTFLSAYPGSSNEQLSTDPLHGISARKVYPFALLPTQTVGSYPTFSPSSYCTIRQLFSVALSVFTKSETRLLAGALLFAVRTFLPFLRIDNAACSTTKVR